MSTAKKYIIAVFFIIGANITGSLFEAHAATCGNRSCEVGENACNCSRDCNPRCGDGCCGSRETSSSCPQDCGSQGPVCGNRTCEPGEDSSNCPQDCPATPVCGNQVCESGENSCTCQSDCPGSCCGNGSCEPNETYTSCPNDCPLVFGQTPISAAVVSSILQSINNHICTTTPVNAQISTGGLVRAGDINAMRSAINDIYNRAPSRPLTVNFTDDPLQAGVTPIRAQHISELETNITNATCCGDGICQSAWENAINCPVECTAQCQNALCEPGEDACNCQQDCPGNCKPYCPDDDGDGYGNSSRQQNYPSGSEPPGWTDLCGDCCDSDASVFPGQGGFFTSANACGNFDYNCDGTEEEEDTYIIGGYFTTSCGGKCTNPVEQGWLQPSPPWIPPCGVTGNHAKTCTQTQPFCTDQYSRTQACR